MTELFGQINIGPMGTGRAATGNQDDSCDEKASSID
jgi:hypothetical protein